MKQLHHRTPVTTKRRKRVLRSLSIEPLETRFAPAVTAQVISNVLYVDGDAAANLIALRLQTGSPNQLQVDVGNNGSPEFGFDRATFDSIIFSGGDGDDTLLINEAGGVFTNTEWTTINGEGGHDSILGGGGNEMLTGGGGHDWLGGGGGNDSLLGSDDSDTLSGGIGNDKLWAGQGRAAATTPVNVDPWGNVQGQWQEDFEAQVSADGRYVVFVSQSDGLVQNDWNGQRDVFRRDLLTGTTTLVSARDGTSQSGNGGAFNPRMSSDGRYVVFESWATDLVPGMDDDNWADDIFVRDMQSGTTTLVSMESTASGTGNGFSWRPGISANGRYVVFLSGSTDLVAGLTDTNGSNDVFVRDLQTGITEAVSVAPGGTATGNDASGDFWQPAISADGRFVVFQSRATDLVTGVTDFNGVEDIFARDLQTGTTSVVSANPAGTATGNDSSGMSKISADGRWVVFSSNASNLVAGVTDTNNAQDIFARDLTTGVTRLVSVTPAGNAAGNGWSGSFDVSADGRVVVFDSHATNLVAGMDVFGGDQVFARDLTTGITQLVSRDYDDPESGNDQSFGPVVSADGRFVAFVSWADNLAASIPGEDDEEGSRVYLGDLRSGLVSLISADHEGAPADDSDQPVISADGHVVVFRSQANGLAPNDTNWDHDLFARTVPTSDSLLGDDGNDSLAGSAGTDSLVGGLGHDSLGGDDGDDRLFGDSGTPTVSGAGNDSLDGGAGSDSLTGGLGNDLFKGGNGDDAILEFGDPALLTLTNTRVTGLGSDTVNSIEFFMARLGAGNNRLDASAFGGPIYVDAGAGNDTLIGSAFDDVFMGNTGADALLGGQGLDLLYEWRDANFTLTNFSLTISGEGPDALASIERVGLDGGFGNNRLDAAAFTAGAVNLDGGGGNDTLIGSPNDDELDGDDGNDSILGGGGHDELDGGDGNDTILGGDGGDEMEGGFGNDSLAGGNGKDELEEYAWWQLNLTLTDTGLTGIGSDSLGGIERVIIRASGWDDRMDASAFTAGSVEFYGNGGNDTLLGSPGDDRLQTESGTDSVAGNGGNDSLHSRYGPDTLTGNDGSDYLEGGEDADSLDGGNGNDSLVNYNGDDTFDGGADNDLLSGGGGQLEDVRGGSGADQLWIKSGWQDYQVLTDTGVNDSGGTRILLQSVEEAWLAGTWDDDLLDASGFSGSVTLDGSDGDDSLLGGDGNDSLVGRADEDTLIGNAGDDSLRGGFGGDSMDGGADTDLAINPGADDTVAGCESTLDLLATVQLFGDVLNLTGTAGADELQIEYSMPHWRLQVTDLLEGGPIARINDEFVGTASVNLGDGDDTLVFKESFDWFEFDRPATILGGPGNDSLLGTTGDDSVAGEAGDDSLFGLGGNDTLSGGAGNDSLDGGGGNDRLAEGGDTSFTLGEDWLDGSSTDEFRDIEEAMLTGGPGANLLDASRFDGPVTLDGAAGNDTLIAGHGGSWLTGGPGSDSMAGGARADVVAELRDANFTLTNSALQISGDGDDTLSSIEGADLRGGAGANRFDASAFTSGAATVHGNGGHDTLIGSPGGDKLRGGDGNDVVSGGDGDDSLGGGPGNDSLAGGAGLDRIEEWGNVNFTLANTLLTGNGADTLAGVERAFLTGGDGNNLLNASAFTAGGVMLNGREGNDTLIGSPGSDSLYGNGDNDSLIGGGGNDSLIAGDLGLISVNAGGVESANNDTPHLGVSANGRYVFFASDATDLVTGLSDTNGSQDIFARDLLTHATTLISINATGAGTGNGGVFDADVSDDGRYVVFISTATDLVTGFTDVANTRDVFLRDMQTGTTTLVSKNVAGTAAGNGDAGEVVITPDGRYVVFESTAGDLVAEDTNGALRDVFRWDRVTDTLTLVSVNVSGTDSGNDESFEASITPDGRYVVFSSWATDLAPGVSDSNLANDVFRRDTQTGTTTLISVHTGGTGAGNAASDEASISDDGRYVLFKSWATDLQSAVPDNNSNADIFMRDVQDGTTALVSVNAEGTAAGNGYTGDGEISPDGRYAVFESEASDLVAGVADNNGQDDVFIRDLQTGTTQMISGNSDGTAAGNGESEEFEFTPDGRFVIFASGADDLVSGGTDTNDSWDVFLRDVQSGTTRLLSIGFLGAAPNNHSGEPSISDDGRVVAFASFATDMLPRAGDGEANVFVRDFSTAERLNGGDGNDVLLGGGGPDSLVGGKGNDQLRAGAGNDLLNGEDGDDTLDGAAGNDRLYGGFGSDYLFGGLGDDLLVGEPQSARPSSRVRDVVIDWAGVNSWVLKPGLKTIITSQNDPRLITIMPAYFPWILFP